MKHIRYIALWLAILFLLSLIPRYNFAWGDTAEEADFALYGDSLTPYNAIISPKTPPETIIIQKAKYYGVDVDLALDLAWFESRYNPNAENPNSTAKGIYQWLDGSWDTYCEGNVFNAEQNIDCAMKVISKDEYGIRHWTHDERTKKMLLNKDYIICYDYGVNNCKLK